MVGIQGVGVQRQREKERERERERDCVDALKKNTNV